MMMKSNTWADAPPRTVSLASGSDGNCLLLSGGGSLILLDAGISCRRINNALKSLGLDIHDISAVLITHNHSDHIRGLGTLCSNTSVPVYATTMTARSIRSKFLSAADKLTEFHAGDSFIAGSAVITSFPTPHDAPESTGFRVSIGGISVGLATDLGYMPDDILSTLEGCDIVYLESNHDEHMLVNGCYPYHLKSRILGLSGHLSNTAAAHAALRLVHSGVKYIILSHLSGHNNTPALAYDTVSTFLRNSGASPDSDIRLDVAPRGSVGEIYNL